MGARIHIFATTHGQAATMAGWPLLFATTHGQAATMAGCYFGCKGSTAGWSLLCLLMHTPHAARLFIGYFCLQK